MQLWTSIKIEKLDVGCQAQVIMSRERKMKGPKGRPDNEVSKSCDQCEDIVATLSANSSPRMQVCVQYFVGETVSLPFAFPMIICGLSVAMNHIYIHYQIILNFTISNYKLLVFCLFFMCIYREGTRPNHMWTIKAMPIKV